MSAKYKKTPVFAFFNTKGGGVVSMWFCKKPSPQPVDCLQDVCASFKNAVVLREALAIRVHPFAKFLED